MTRSAFPCCPGEGTVEGLADQKQRISHVIPVVPLLRAQSWNWVPLLLMSHQLLVPLLIIEIIWTLESAQKLYAVSAVQASELLVIGPIVVVERPSGWVPSSPVAVT